MRTAFYRPRVVDTEMRARLAALPVVLVEGPKACGKTFTARQVARSEVLLDIDAEARSAAAVDPSLILGGETPRLIDEWQFEPSIWNHVRRFADDRGAPGQFVLCGSSTPADDATRHTGAGRVGRVRMRPMSLFESGHSTGQVSLGSLLDGGPVRSDEVRASVSEIAARIAAGGWPGLQALPVDGAVVAVRSYLEEVARVDLRGVDGIRRDPRRVSRLLRALARNVATSASITTIAADTFDADEPVARTTAYDYLAALERLMLVEDQPAWSSHLRSRTQARTTAKRHFVDPSLAVAALGATPERLLRDLNALGLLFESLVVRDLRVYAQAHDAYVSHYRDNKGFEIDAIVETRRGALAAFEVKLGGADAIDRAARNLTAFARRLDPDAMIQPARLGVIVASGYGYQRDDGVAVIPITALGP